jgi:hypothetical protein
MKKHLSLLTAGLVALLLTSCGDSIIEANDSPISTNASLKIQVLDEITRNPLPGATVTLLSTGNVKKTDSSGSVVFKDVRVGSHGYQIELEGYAGYVSIGNVSSPDIYGDIYIASESFSRLSLYPLNSGLEGVLNYVDKDNKRFPANGATIRITFTGGTLLNSVYETTVENGKYSFENLPAVGAAYTITALQQEFGSDTYRNFNLTSLALVPNIVVTQQTAAEYAYANRVTPPFYITEYNRYVDTTGNIVFKFSDSVDVNKSRVTLNAGVVGAIAWSEGNRTLTISPKIGTVTTKWSNDVTVTLNPLISGSNVALTGGVGHPTYTVVLNIDLSTPLGIAVVKCDSINGIPELCEASNTPQDLNVTKIDISWPKVPGATAYRIFAKASAGDDYFIRLVDSPTLTNPNSPSYSISAATLRTSLGISYTTTPLGVQETQPFNKVTTTGGVRTETPETLEFFVQAIRVSGEYYSDGLMTEAVTGKLTLTGGIPPVAEVP